MSCVFSRRQIDEYSPHVVKRQRLDSSSDLLIAPSLIRGPPPRHPEVLAGSSRSGFDRRFPSPHSRPRPQVPAVPESPNSLQTYAKDKVLYIQITLNCSWFTSVWLCVLAGMLYLVRVHVFVPLVEWSDGGAVWSLPAADVRFGPEGDVSNSATARHTACLWRCVWNTQSCSALIVYCESNWSVFLIVARLYLTGSSMNGLGCRSSDADLCLVLKGNVSISNSAVWLLSKIYLCIITDTHVLLNTCVFLFQKRHDPIHVLSVLQRLFRSLCEFFKTIITYYQLCCI